MEKAITKTIEENNINLLTASSKLSELERLFDYLETKNIINFSLEAVNKDSEDKWLQIIYFQKSIEKIIIVSSHFPVPQKTVEIATLIEETNRQIIDINNKIIRYTH